MMIKVIKTNIETDREIKKCWKMYTEEKMMYTERRKLNFT